MDHVNVQDKFKELIRITKEDDLALKLSSEDQDKIIDIAIKIHDGGKLDAQDQTTISIIHAKIA